MKKTVITLSLMVMVALNIFAQETPQEKDFKSRLEAFQKAADMEKLPTIYEMGSPCLMMMSDCDKLEAVIVRGIKSVEFHEVFPVIKESVQKGVSLEGFHFVPNLEPYKMVSIEFQTPIKNGTAGVSILTGIKDGKIMICSYKKAEKK